jgi:hypothetical protein
MKANNKKVKEIKKKAKESIKIIKEMNNKTKRTQYEI